MHLANYSLPIMIVVGLVAGWLIGVLIKGSGLGPTWDVIIGWLGALIGYCLLPWLHFNLGDGLVAVIVKAVIGAVALLAIVRVLNGQGLLPRRRWGRGQ